MIEGKSAFEKAHEAGMLDPEYRRGHVIMRRRISTIDYMVNMLDDARRAQGLTKAALGRMIDMNDAGVRRLFTNAGANPRLSTLSDLATALGYQVVLVPLPDDERREIDEALR